MFDLESEGEKNEFSGNVAVKNSLVPAEVFVSMLISFTSLISSV